MKHLLLLLSLLCLPCLAAPKADSNLASAQNTVKTYQQLRDSCAKAQGQARQDCLSRLASSSDDYRAATALLASTASLNRTRRR